MIDYSITNEYGYKSDYSYLDSVIKRVMTHENITKASFSIVFVGNEKIQELNKFLYNFGLKIKASKDNIYSKKLPGY